MSDQTRPFDIGTLGGSEPPLPSPRDRAEGRRPVAWNGAADIGLLLLRFLIGGLFFAHGAQKVLGMWGGLGLAGTAENLRGHGFVAQADALAWALGIAEMAAGAFVVLGLLTPLAAAGLLSIKIVAVAVKWGSVPLYAAAAPDALEVDLLLGGGAAALVFTGAGRIALDRGRTWQRRPLPYAWLSLVVALGVAAVVYFLLRG
ncbi:DoxX family protein [Pseudonocardia lacus]|uniref:DoxX family protein n=1 Tax=Pseudonocardia lacus TaxID=2835865 RepID=UPI001BDBCB04|nr:DoxX family protein [Pseudonocardia lacus]